MAVNEEQRVQVLREETKERGNVTQVEVPGGSNSRLQLFEFVLVEPPMCPPVPFTLSPLRYREEEMSDDRCVAAVSLSDRSLAGKRGEEIV